MAVRVLGELRPLHAGLVAELNRHFPRFAPRGLVGHHHDGGKRPPRGGRSDFRSRRPTAQGFPDGEVTQHGDLAHDRLAHAGGHNGPSVGIEVVNPYYPKYASAKLPWKRVIDAPWAHQRRYVVPTPEQAEATAQLVQLLTSGDLDGLAIPRTWRGLSGTRLSVNRIADGDQRVPGIYAHTYFHHADGAWLVLYAWLRLEAGMPECIAYEESIRRATGVRRFVEVADLMSDAVA